MEIMSNPHADRVRATARLISSAGRRKAGSFLVEGPQAVREAVRAHAAGRAQVQELFITAERAEREPELMGGPDLHRHLVTEEVLAALTDTVSPQGVVARCALPQTSLADVVLPGAGLIAVLARVQDPGNAGTILRAADAAGATGVIALSGTVDLFSPKVVRSTVGSLFHLPAVTGVSLTELGSALSGVGITALAADGYGDTDLDVLQDDAAARRVGVTAKGAAQRVALSAPTAWLFGNEGSGLSDEELAACRARVAIPLYGAAESLNVGTAATLCLYASARAQRGQG
ncbi:TrmH family RNA methyltransferase [Galactobacter caseinivorans]|uniref:RNA methyltransferase n=1 Tax=Galactobacter caseinivorans TaxID=2676123 RepID=A0A496PJY5_9MICC|nr:RNA methyltransferase [Galactobacter caseinivorans]RKW70823.1 RNA methyltransferase [Galactobacter caseinivorans]